VSKARLVITAVVVEGRSQSEVARTYGVSQGWISKLVKRYQLEGAAAFQPRSRRPHTSPARLAQSTIDLILSLRGQLAGKGLDHGPHTIAWHLEHHHGLRVSANTIHRHLRAAGLITPQPHKRPKSSYIRFAAHQPNERWQADFTHWWLADGTHVEILNWIDDHARYALSVTAHRRVTGAIVLAEFRKAVANHGIPYSTLTDNGMEFTTRFSGGKGGRNHFETELRRLGVTQINSTPNHPTTAGKSSASTRPSKNGSPPSPPPPPSPNCKPSSTSSSTPTTATAHTVNYPGAPPRPPSTPPAPKPPPANASTPTTGCAPTASTNSENSPCATPAGYTTSASVEPTPRPAYSS
jgi:transposase